MRLRAITLAILGVLLAPTNASAIETYSSSQFRPWLQRVQAKRPPAVSSQRALRPISVLTVPPASYRFR